ncbi:threonylcarbamoyl-AMP synthase [archaeon]|nr:threonylcarbamoyl-AMP synthase [archaeon]
MKILSQAVDSEKQIVASAVKCLLAEEIIVYPTDTIYGIGADATNSKAVQKVYSLKQRNPQDPISVMISDFRMLRKYAKIEEHQLEFLHELLPGRVSVILESQDTLAENLSPDSSISFRLPLHPLCIKIVENFGKPITTTSANKSGIPVSENFDAVIDEFQESVALYIDGGDLPFNSSTLVDLRGEPKVLREGMGIEKVRAVLK